MGKNDFDIDFDFEEEYGFDPKAFLGTEEYDKDIDLDAFSDEELGLTSHDKSEEEASAPEEEADGGFDLDEDLDLDEFLNLGSQEETYEEDEEEEDPEEEEADWEEEAEEEEAEEFQDEEPELEEDEEVFEEEYAEEEAQFDSDPDLLEDTDLEETDMNNREYTEEYEEQEGFEDQAIDEEFEESESGKKPRPVRKPRPKKERQPIQLPKFKTPKFLIKFYDIYFAPVLHKELREEPQDPNKPRRRRKSKQQIFKEVYLPPIIACVCLVLVMSFLIGSVSNAIQLRRIEKEKEASQLSESVSAAQQAQQQSQIILAEAEALAAGYNYDDAITKLDSLGDLTQYPELSAKRSEYVLAKDALVEIKDTTSIPNLSFHVLIHDMARAQQDTDDLKGNYNRNFVTTGEFTKILNDLYNNGYVLVDFDSFVGSATTLDGTKQFSGNSIWLPADKKPVMITETMVNYFEYMVDGDKDGQADAKGDGFASKLVIDSNGDVKAEYVDANGQTSVGNYDLVPILEDFIKEHPDFSYRGARAILAVTGEQGVFGYRCNTSYISTVSQEYYNEQVAGAQQITQKLRDLGYTIACYTYGNVAYGKLSVAQIQADLQSWTQQVTSVIGEVDTLVFAKLSNITDYSGGAFTVLQNTGFRYYIAHDDDPYTEINTSYVRQNRLMVTGENIQWYPDQFNGLFDCAAVLELSTRGSVPKSS